MTTRKLNDMKEAQQLLSLPPPARSDPTFSHRCRARGISFSIEFIDHVVDLHKTPALFSVHLGWISVRKPYPPMQRWHGNRKSGEQKGMHYLTTNAKIECNHAFMTSA